MTVSPASEHPSRGSLIEARVTSLTTRATTLGDRTYAVFEAVDGSVLGFWSRADHPALQTLRVNDTVSLMRKANGHLSLAPQPVSYANRVGIFALIQRLWRLT